MTDVQRPMTSPLPQGWDEGTTGEVREILGVLLARMGETSGTVNSCITATPDMAEIDLQRVMAARASGSPLPLDGMTLVVKDNIDVGGVRATRGSDWFRDRIAPQDATVVARARMAGAIVVGKANLHEFAYGGTNNNPHYGPVRNPWDLRRIPGGSSGGSAAAVAADVAQSALGTDTGGSVRCPASFCGLTGLRPTFGVVSNLGVYPIGPSFDTVGPIARRATDVQRLFMAIVGQDVLDPDSRPYLGAGAAPDVPVDLSDLSLGVPTNYFFDGLDPEVSAYTRAGIDQLVALGARPVEISVTDAEAANEVATLVIRAEALSIHHDRLEKDPGRFGDDVRRRLLLGNELSGWRVAGLYQELKRLRLQLLRVFSQVDVVATPTVPNTAPPIDSSEMIATTAMQTKFTYPWSVAHVPGISFPCGFSNDGLPIGLQLVGRPFSEWTLCRIGSAYQTVTDWNLRRALPGEVR